MFLLFVSGPKKKPLFFCFCPILFWEKEEGPQFFRFFGFGPFFLFFRYSPKTFPYSRPTGKKSFGGGGGGPAKNFFPPRGKFFLGEPGFFIKKKRLGEGGHLKLPPPPKPPFFWISCFSFLF